ncbi:MAG: GNAT family N-acetyltransferase [Alphaproteobacteria bacterium]
MMRAGAIPVGLARERTGDAQRSAAGARAEWSPLAALADVRTEWRDLVARALEPNVFYDPAFALPAARAFGADVGAVLVWSKTSPRLIGLFPARIERRYGVIATLNGWTHPYAPLGVPLIDRDEADAAIAAFLDHVEVGAGLPKLVMLPLIARDGAFAAALARVLARRAGASASFGEHARALLAPRNRENYLEHIAGKKLKELRRQRRRLEESGAVVHMAASGPAAAVALTDFMALEASGWKGRAGGAARAHAAIETFVRQAVTALAAKGDARVDRLIHDGHPVAASITLRSGNAAWFWKIAYDEAFARASPGVQLTLDLTRDLLADGSLARTDSCATAGHPMIDHLWKERLTLCDMLIAPGASSMAQLRLARPLETLRRAVISSVKKARASLRAGPRPARAVPAGSPCRSSSSAFP